jgi:excinuclease ABC subunit A
MKKDKHSITGKYISGEKKISMEKSKLVTTRGTVDLMGATMHNLKTC